MNGGMQKRCKDGWKYAYKTIAVSESKTHIAYNFVDDVEVKNDFHIKVDLK